MTDLNAPTIANLRQAEAAVRSRGSEVKSAMVNVADAEYDLNWVRETLSRAEAAKASAITLDEEVAADKAVTSARAEVFKWQAPVKAAEKNLKEKVGLLHAAEHWLNRLRTAATAEQQVAEAKEIRRIGRESMEASFEALGFRPEAAKAAAAMGPRTATPPTPKSTKAPATPTPAPRPELKLGRLADRWGAEVRAK